MKIMWALLWKEGREEAYKVFFGVGLCLLVLLLRNHSQFNHSFSGGAFTALSHGFLAICAAGMAMETVARERAQGTMHFLLGKPLSEYQILLPKFVVGLAAMFLFTMAAWATVYMNIEGIDTSWSAAIPFKMVVQEVDYLSMVLIWYAPYAMLYAVVFCGSAMSDNAFKGVALGGLLVVALVLLFAGLAYVFPQIMQFRFIDVGPPGHILRLAAESEKFLMRQVVASVVVLFFLWLSVRIVRRLRDSYIEWKTVIAIWALCGVGVGVFALSAEEERPKGTPRWFAAEKGQFSDMELVGELGYILNGDAVIVVDASDPLDFKRIAKLEVPLWELHRVAVVDSLLYILGTRKGMPSDSLGIVVIDPSTGQSPRLIGAQMLGTVQGFAGVGDWLAVDGGLVYGGRIADELKLLAFKVDAAGLPIPAGSLVLSKILSADHNIYKFDENNIHMRSGQQRIFISTVDYIAIVDVTDFGSLKETFRIKSRAERKLIGFHYYSQRPSRMLAIDGDRLYFRRFWPRELVVMDISNPDQPREIEYYPWGDNGHEMVVNDGVVWIRWSGRVEGFKLTDYEVLEECGFWGGSGNENVWSGFKNMSSHMVVVGDQAVYSFPIKG